MQLTIDYIFLSKVMSGKMIGYEKYFLLPPVRIELTTPGLRDQCSTTELKRLCLPGARFQISSNMQHLMSKIVCLSFDFL